jgi:predicted amidohydrolase YtcJ
MLAPHARKPLRPRFLPAGGAVLLPVLLFLAAACGGEPPPAGAGAGAEAPAELILVDARIYTLDWGEPDREGVPAPDAPVDAEGRWHPDAEAVAIRDGRILRVGSREAVEALRGPETRVVDLGGAVLLPGLVESHAHLLSLGNSLVQVNLVGVATEEEAVRRVEARAAEAPPGSWIVGRGWDEGAWANRYPDRSLLSARVPDHPVWLRGLHGFAGWANDRALAEAGITAGTEPPVGGEILLGPDGEPSGIFLNRAVALMDARVPALAPDEVRDRIARAMDELARSGYTSVHDAGTSAEVLEALEALEGDGALPVRVYAMLNARDEALSRRWIQRGPRTGDPESFLRVRSVKAYYDAALGSRGARLLEDYADLPGHRGVSGEGYGFDQALVAELVRAGFQVGIHAIGDAGNREVLDFLEAIAAEDPGLLDLRHRIEHAQVVHPDDLARFGELRLTASMEPPHAVEDKAWAEARLGPERLRGAYAWRSLRRAGAHLVFNADLPGSDHDIFYGLHAAMTRRDRDAEPPGGWLPEERMTPEEAVRAYTSWAAWSEFAEERGGKIREGYRADLTALDLDPFVVGAERPEALLGGRVVGTWVGGRDVGAGRR